MKAYLERSAALALLRKYNSEPFHIQHALTVEGVMRWYANELGHGEDADFYALKGMVVAVLTAVGVKDLAWKRAGAAAPWLHPGRGAVVSCGQEVRGTLGEVHPDTMEAFDSKVRAYVAELDLTALEKVQTYVSGVREMPRFPAVQRDLALVMDEGVAVGPLMADMRRAAGKLLESMELFDVYRGAQVAAGHKSVAFSLTFRAPDRTLTDEEVQAAMDKVTRACAEKHGATVRA